LNSSSPKAYDGSIDEALDLGVSAAALFRVKDVVRQGEAQNVTETKSFDYIAATAALQR
jgi:hypothetical protein